MGDGWGGGGGGVRKAGKGPAPGLASDPGTDAEGSAEGSHWPPLLSESPQ